MADILVLEREMLPTKTSSSVAFCSRVYSYQHTVGEKEAMLTAVSKQIVSCVLDIGSEIYPGSDD